MDLTLLTCNYNTPLQTLNLIKSLKVVGGLTPRVLVINTSTQDDSEDLFITNNIPYLNLRGSTHGEGVNFGISNIKTRYVLLVDTDIIFLKDITPVFEKFKSGKYTLMGNVVGDCCGKLLHPRVEPWFCMMDLQQLKNNNIIFFDSERSKKPKIKGVRVYDIGSTMYEDIINKNLYIGNVNLNHKYFKHYGGMSWRIQKYNPHSGDTDIDFGGTHPHRAIYDAGVSTKENYERETEYLNNIDLTNYFL